MYRRKPIIMVWLLNYLWYPFSGPTIPERPPLPPIRLHLTLSFEPTRDTIQDFESDWQIYGPSDLKITLLEQMPKGAEWMIEGLGEEKFDVLADVVDRWVKNGRCVKAWMQEEGGLAAMRRWDLKS